MEEKTYKLLGGSGALNIAVGAVVLVSGIASGVLLIVNGEELLPFPGVLRPLIKGDMHRLVRPDADLGVVHG